MHQRPLLVKKLVLWRGYPLKTNIPKLKRKVFCVIATLPKRHKNRNWLLFLYPFPMQNLLNSVLAFSH